MNKKRFVTLAIVLIVVVVLAAAGIWYYEAQRNTVSVQTTQNTNASTSNVSFAGGPCGGNVAHPLTCPAGYYCAPNPSSTPPLPFGDVGGTCVAGSMPSKQNLSLSIAYKNNKYGFTYSLPADWKGFSIVTEEWEGYDQTDSGDVTIATGTELYIRNPNWTSSDHYEDLPVMIFSLAQWNSYEAGNFNVTAAPFPAGEIGRNNQYVFALPPRWDYDFATGYQEAEAIISEKPLQPFNL